jgi:hypothetical protein
MARDVTIKLTNLSPKVGPFDIYDNFGRVIATDVSRKQLTLGITYNLSDDITLITLKSTGQCKLEKSKQISTISYTDYVYTKVYMGVTGCMWTHLKNPSIYNTFYGNINSYIIEYPFAYQYQDQILHNIVDYSKVYQYVIENSFGEEIRKIELDDVWFNKAVLYNGQQSSGLLELVPKPKNNLQNYMSYPIYNTSSKTIIFTKSDNFYQYNGFWSIVKDPHSTLFNSTCISLSHDKEVNDDNMDYGVRSFLKSPIRAKELKVRHILDNRGDVNIVSQFINAPAQISFK